MTNDNNVVDGWMRFGSRERSREKDRFVLEGGKASSRAVFLPRNRFLVVVSRVVRRKQNINSLFVGKQ